jgi:glycosyltransferase involved in cell wall biosynthesis
MPSSLMLLTYPYRPDPRVFREARALVRHGAKVRLIAWDREGDLPKHADENGVEVIRVGPKCPYRSAGKVISRLPRFWFKALRASRKLDFDIIHCHDFDTLPLGLLISKLRRTPVLYDAHELYSEMVRKDVGSVSDLVWRAESCLAKKPEELVTVNEKLAEKLSEGRKTKARIVTNSPDTGILEGLDAQQIRERHNLRGFVVSYLGSMEPGRFVEELVASVEPSDKVTLAMGGNGTLRPVAEKASLHNSAIRFLGTLDTDEALRVTWASDIVVAMLDPTNPNYRASTPVKVLDAMACGRPVVTSQGLDISKKVEEIGCGFVIPYDRAAFRETLLKATASPKLLETMGRKGLEYYEKELSWERSRDELLKAYKALVGQF